MKQSIKGVNSKIVNAFRTVHIIIPFQNYFFETSSFFSNLLHVLKLSNNNNTISLPRGATAVSLAMVTSVLRGLCAPPRRSTMARPQPRTLMTTCRLGGSLRPSPRSLRPGDSASTTEAAKYNLFITTRKAELLNLSSLQTGSKI